MSKVSSCRQKQQTAQILHIKCCNRNSNIMKRANIPPSIRFADVLLPHRRMLPKLQHPDSAPISASSGSPLGVEPPPASAPPSRSMTSSPTASSASFRRLRAAFSFPVVPGATIGTVPFRFPPKCGVHHTADRTGLAAGMPLVGCHDAGAVPLGLVTYLFQQQAGKCRRRPRPWIAALP